MQEADVDSFPDDDDTQSSYAGALRENANIWKSAFHIFKANVGTGVFMLPTFYPDAGYIMAPILSILISLAVIDSTELLLRAKLIVNRKDAITYAELVRYVNGPAMQWFLIAALCVSQFGFCLMYSQLGSATMDELVGPFHGSNYVWVTMVFLFGFASTCFSDNLSLLAIASIIATLAVSYSLICCFVQSCMTISKLGGGVHKTTTTVGKDIPIGWFNNLANNMMVLEGIAIVLPVHEACTQKPLVPRMVAVVLLIVVLWYLLFGLTGYLAYGAEITKSLVSAMEMSPWGTSIRVFFIVNLVFTYPLQFQSAIQLIDQKLGCKPRSWRGILSRLLANLIIWGLAMGLGADAVNTVVSFIGALPATLMVFIFPAFLTLQVEYSVDHPDESRMKWSYWKRTIVGNPCMTLPRLRAFVYIVVAILIMVIGTFSIVRGLVEK